MTTFYEGCSVEFVRALNKESQEELKRFNVWEAWLINAQCDSVFELIKIKFLKKKHIRLQKRKPLGKH